MNDSMSRSRPRESRKQKYKNKYKKWIYAAVICLLLLILPSVIVMAWNFLGDDSENDSIVNTVSNEVKNAVDNAEEENQTEAEPANEPIAEKPETNDETAETPENSDVATGSTDDAAEKVEMAFVGDVLLGSTVSYLLERHGMDYPYTHIREQLQQPDITVANLETPITELEETKEQKSYLYRSSPETLPAFVEAGFDLVTLANNHILDYGVEGLRDTIAHLDKADIKHVGAGEDEIEAYQPVIIEQNGIKTAFIGLSMVVPRVEWKANKYNPGVAETYSYERAVKAIERAEEEADVVVVLPHWGDERQQEPKEQQVNMAYRYIDAGADLVVGSHPHVLQTVERYKGKWIVYSMGNFIFTTNDFAPSWESGIFNASCNNTGDCELKLKPITNRFAQPKFLEENEAQRLLSEMETRSQGVTIDAQGNIKPAES